jgi:membrane protease YdiL (CAAX protease family)
MSDSSPSRPWFAQLARPQTPPPWTLGDVGSTFVALALAILMLGPALANILFNTFSNPIIWLFSWLVGLVIATAFALFTRRGQFAALRLGSGDSRWPLPYALLVGVAAALTIDLVAGLVAGFRPVVLLANLGQSGASEWVIGGAFIALIQPIAEGLIFQGVTLPRFRASFGAWPGFVATTILYTVYFVAVYSTSLSGGAFVWYGIIVPLLSAVVLNAVRIYTESTRAVIITQMGMGLTFLLAAIALAN